MITTLLNFIVAPIFAGAFFALPILLLFPHRPRIIRTMSFHKPILEKIGQKHHTEDQGKSFVLGQI
jgi:Flp pilus assembly protein protease CpaA